LVIATSHATMHGSMNVKSKNHSENTRKARNQGTKENSHTGHCTHTAESNDVKKHKTYLTRERTVHVA